MMTVNVQTTGGLLQGQIYDASDDDGRKNRPESLMRRKSSTGSMKRKENDEDNNQAKDEKQLDQEDNSSAGYLLPDLEEYMNTPRRSSKGDDKQESLIRTPVTQISNRSPRGSISAFSTSTERRRSVNDISFNIQPRKSITEMTPKMQKQIAKFENSYPEEEIGEAAQIRVETNRRSSRNIDDVSDYRRRRSSTKDEGFDLTRRRSSTRDEALDLNRRRSSTRDEIIDPNRRSLNRDETFYPQQRRSSTKDEILEPNRRRSSTKDEDIDLNRRKSSTRDENFYPNQRMSSMRDQVPNPGRKSSIRNEPDSNSRKLSTDYESVYLDQHKSSTRNDSVDEDDTRISTERRKSSTRDDVLVYGRRKSSAGGDIVYIDQRRLSSKENLPGMERRPSLKEKVTTIEKNWIISENIDALERRLSNQNPEVEPESEGKASETPEVPVIQVRRFSDLVDEDYINVDDEELEEQFRKSMTPYLKYRKSVSDLEPYLQHQEEITKMTPEIKTMMEVNEMSSENEFGESVNNRSPPLLSENLTEDRSPQETADDSKLNEETLNYLVRRFSSQPIPDHKSLQPDIIPWDGDNSHDVSPDTKENDNNVLKEVMTLPRRRSSIVLEERWSKRNSQAEQESSPFKKPTEDLESLSSIDTSPHIEDSLLTASSSIGHDSYAEQGARSPRGSSTGQESHSPRGSYLSPDELEVPIREDQRRKSLTTTFFDFVVRRLSAQVDEGIDIMPQENDTDDSEREEQRGETVKSRIRITGWNRK
ncbi:hypothetical protein E2C01_022402 [Portunus trituberculatus]|uniref:Uncharacterized protein n=1 Tax=Portunus trituberculatus TaxID=210409 RepID=A0A5B7E5B8_PORTR|nr:hypothetical protein [Portunus trituberculatus]